MQKERERHLNILYCFLLEIKVERERLEEIGGESFGTLMIPLELSCQKIKVNGE